MIRNGKNNKNTIETIYFGGKYASLLSEIQIENILRHINSFNMLNNNNEITLELNQKINSLNHLLDNKVNRINLMKNNIVIL